MQITGTHINYYFVCKRELWNFSHGLQMEHTSDIVYTGKVIDENSYDRKEKHLDIDNIINIDWIDTKTSTIHEVKKSDAVEKAHEMQVLYYIWYLKQKGVDNLKAEIDYPTLKQKYKIELSAEKEKEIQETMLKISATVEQTVPPERINKKFCKTCSYFELCWV